MELKLSIDTCKAKGQLQIIFSSRFKYFKNTVLAHLEKIWVFKSSNEHHISSKSVHRPPSQGNSGIYQTCLTMSLTLYVHVSHEQLPQTTLWLDRLMCMQCILNSRQKLILQRISGSTLQSYTYIFYSGQEDKSFPTHTPQCYWITVQIFEPRAVHFQADLPGWLKSKPC